MSPVVFLIVLIISPAIFSHPLLKVKKPSIDEMPQKIVELIEFSMPSSSPVNEFIPSPYQFGYQFGDDPLGVYRSVEYIADSDGYRAVIRTNEPGSVAKDMGHAKYIVATPPAAALEQGLLYKQRKLNKNL
ncbi:hypothetical protein HNY73_018377 [Argiope bruennichi]|uniref:Uncharacterized protein n=1 Tax=Argiope bruennichi TaxID=94029 RepID=A0A8T0EE20_ARGBR|nr:hypothetical protein HNY73_018377 [Argiope bruennichi]